MGRFSSRFCSSTHLPQICENVVQTDEVVFAGTFVTSDDIAESILGWSMEQGTVYGQHVVMAILQQHQKVHPGYLASIGSLIISMVLDMCAQHEKMQQHGQRTGASTRLAVRQAAALLGVALQRNLLDYDRLARKVMLMDHINEIHACTPAQDELKGGLEGGLEGGARTSSASTLHVT